MIAAIAIGCFLASGAPSPNIVVILADDQGWGDLGIHGNTAARTPHLDSLARQGARFDRFFVQPVCAPTRAEFLTGRWHPRGGVHGVSTGAERLDLDERTIADFLRQSGYATGCFGKWHNGSQFPYHPLGRGFGEYYGYTSGHWGEYFDAPLEHNGVMKPSQGYIVDVLTDKALQFIERNRARPFVCYVPFTTPHSPFSVPPEDWARFKDKPLTQLATNPKAELPDATRCVLAMLENHRTGLVWRTMQKNPHLRRGLKAAGFEGGWLGAEGATK